MYPLCTPPPLPPLNTDLWPPIPKPRSRCRAFRHKRAKSQIFGTFLNINFTRITIVLHSVDEAFRCNIKLLWTLPRLSAHTSQIYSSLTIELANRQQEKNRISCFPMGCLSLTRCPVSPAKEVELCLLEILFQAFWYGRIGTCRAKGASSSANTSPWDVWILSLQLKHNHAGLLNDSVCSKCMMAFASFTEARVSNAIRSNASSLTTCKPQCNFHAWKLIVFTLLYCPQIFKSRQSFVTTNHLHTAVNVICSYDVHKLETCMGAIFFR